MQTLTHEQVFEKVQHILVECLSVEPEEVTPEATLMGDLGAESIDMLDVSFHLEKTFSIKIAPGDLAPDVLNNPDYIEGNLINAQGLARLKEALPHLDLTSFERNPEKDRLMDLFTVKSLVRYIEGRLKAA